MSPIQGVSAAAASAYASRVQSAAPAPKLEARESGRDERAEANRGAQEMGESGGSSTVGTRFNAIA